MGPDGSIYYGDGEGEYRRAPDGTIRLGLGGGYSSFSDGADAFSVRDFAPGNNLRAVGPDGTLYLDGERAGPSLLTGGPGSAFDLNDRRAADMKIGSVRSLHLSRRILTKVSDGPQARALRRWRPPTPWTMPHLYVTAVTFVTAR